MLLPVDYTPHIGAYPDVNSLFRRRRRGCRSMAGPELPKLKTWVRSPSPAPIGLVNTSVQSISVTVNGNSRQLHQGVTVAQLLAQLDTAGKRVAVERNGEIVPRSLHASTALAGGDQLEIVVAVGGG